MGLRQISITGNTRPSFEQSSGGLFLPSRLPDSFCLPALPSRLPHQLAHLGRIIGNINATVSVALRDPDSPALLLRKNLPNLIDPIFLPDRVQRRGRCPDLGQDDVHLLLEFLYRVGI